MVDETTNEVIAYERLGPCFEKWHLNCQGKQPWPFRPVLHRFSEPDHGDPHDHPFGFRSFVLKGSYVEEVFDREEDGTWTSTRIHRREGESHDVPATHIHRIVALPEGECWTLVIYGPTEREHGFWRPVGVGREWVRP